MVSPVGMYGCESWIIKKAEHRRTDVFEMWCWRRLLRVPWTAKRPNQSILKEINLEYSLEGLMLKLQYFGHYMWKSWLVGKNPDARKEWGQEEKGMTEYEMVGWHHWLNGHEFEQTRKLVMGKKAWCAAVHGVKKSWKQLRNLKSNNNWSIIVQFSSATQSCPTFWAIIDVCPEI